MIIIREALKGHCQEILGPGPKKGWGASQPKFLTAKPKLQVTCRLGDVFSDASQTVLNFLVLGIQRLPNSNHGQRDCTQGSVIRIKDQGSMINDQ